MADTPPSVDYRAKHKASQDALQRRRDELGAASAQGKAFRAGVDRIAEEAERNG